MKDLLIHPNIPFFVLRALRRRWKRWRWWWLILDESDQNVTLASTPKLSTQQAPINAPINFCWSKQTFTSQVWTVEWTVIIFSSYDLILKVFTGSPILYCAFLPLGMVGLQSSKLIILLFPENSSSQHGTRKRGAPVGSVFLAPLPPFPLISSFFALPCETFNL